MMCIKRMINLLICIIFLISIGCSYANSVHYVSVEDMVSHQEVIRVLIDSAPGFGNHAASLNAMSQLRQMGFNGTYEVIYPDSEKDKVVALFGLPNDLPAVYSDNNNQDNKIKFYKESVYYDLLMQHQIQPVLLGITGAHDNRFGEYIFGANDVHSYNRNFYSNLADLTDTQIFIEWQPWYDQSEGDDRIVISGFYSVNARSSNAEPQPDGTIVSPRGKYFVYPVATLKDTKNYLQNDKIGKALNAKTPGLLQLISAIEAKDINFMPIYGCAFQKWFQEYNQKENHDYNPSGDPVRERANVYPQNIMTVLAAARYAQLSNRSALMRPMVIAVFYNYEQELHEIEHFINEDWGDYESQGGTEARAVLATLGLNNKNIFSTASVTDPDINSKLQALKPGQIMLLSMGVLPKTVFDGLFTYTADNILPPIREGEGTLNILLTTGHPHFRCEDEFGEGSDRWELDLSLVSDSELRNKLALFYGENGFCSSNSWKTDPLFYTKLGDLIIQAQDPASSLVRYFQDVKQDASIKENDRIYRGLEEALKVVNSR